jgi:hypothetical protein
MVTLLRRGWAALSIIILASLLAAGPAGAQRPQPTSTDVGFVGIPEYTSAETGIPFFFPEVGQHADKAMSDMRNAATP